MFNLLMSGMENTWDAPTWVLPNDRYLGILILTSRLNLVLLMTKL